MKTLEPEITAGWCANVKCTAAAMEAGATVQDWLGTTAAEAQLTMKAFIAEMGVRAPEGRAALWRNWSRIFSIRVLTQVSPDAALPKITGMETILPKNAELHNMFTTPRATRDALETRSGKSRTRFVGAPENKIYYEICWVPENLVRYFPLPTAMYPFNSSGYSPVLAYQLKIVYLSAPP